MFCAHWKVGGEDYKLRLTTLNAIQVEKQLKMGLIEAVNHLADTTVTVMLLWGGLQEYNHGMKFTDVCELYDKYVAEGGSADKIVDVLAELLSQVGIGEAPKPEAKNAESLMDVPSIVP